MWRDDWTTRRLREGFLSGFWSGSCSVSERIKAEFTTQSGASDGDEFSESARTRAKNPVMEKQIGVLDNKLKTLKFRLSRTDEILDKGDRTALERQLGSITAIADAVNSIKEEIQEKKFAKGESEEDIASCSANVEQHVEQADEVIKKLRREIKAIDLQEKEEQAAEKHKKEMAFELERLEQQAKFKELHEQKKSSTAKLPEFAITKFNGKIEEWLPFWGKFTAEIDSTKLASLTKFGYLKELLERTRGVTSTDCRSPKNVTRTRRQSSRQNMGSHPKS